jgi:hypothetical protein
MNLAPNNKALKELTDMFNSKKIMNVAQLTSTYSQKELVLLEKTCLQSVKTIQIGMENNIIHEHFPNPFELIVFINFLTTQGQLLERAILYNEGIHLMNMTTLEGTEILKIYNN